MTFLFAAGAQILSSAGAINVSKRGNQLVAKPDAFIYE